MRVASILIASVIVFLFACKTRTGPDFSAHATDSSANMIIDTIGDDEGEMNYAAVKSDLDSLFNEYKDSLRFDVDEMWYSLHIGHLFDKKNKHAVMHFYLNDSISKILVLKLCGRQWDTIFSVERDSAKANYMRLDDYYTFSDFNGDGIPDLKIVNDYWDIHPGENADLWLFRKDSFISVKNFSEIVTADYDKKTRLIYSYQSAGCADMAMVFGVYKIVDDTVQIKKLLNCDCCEADSCIINIYNQKTYRVPYEKAYLHVPSYYASFVKAKCEM
ncbi:hypothetical protein ACE38W_11175 [Chitinophaga sp. Hz27]|uniref:XAC2610-related protein n=1 Tax=Chitinophaga sp. Hz27 TaxID=3347169 RepID=UPI0035DAA76F